jgi:hypothetical protein
MVSALHFNEQPSEIYPDKSEDLHGMQRFFRQFSFPGGIGSHATPRLPAASTRAVSWATVSRTPTGRSMTTRSRSEA